MPPPHLSFMMVGLVFNMACILVPTVVWGAMVIVAVLFGGVGRGDIGCGTVCVGGGGYMKEYVSLLESVFDGWGCMVVFVVEFF